MVMYAAEKVGGKLLGGEHRLGKRLAAAGVVGGVALALLSGTPNTSKSAKVNHLGLKSVTLEPGKYCDAKFVANVSTQATWHLHKGPSWVPDIMNHTVKMKGDIESEVCIKQKAIVVKPDSEHPDKLRITLHGDPDPNKSDLILTSYAKDPTKMKYSSSGNIVDALLGGAIGDIKALAQVAGLSFDSFGDNIDSQLGGVAFTIGTDAAAAGCSNLAIQKLNSPTAKKINKNTGPNAPQTMAQDVEDQLIKQYSIQYHKALGYDDFIWDLTMAPGGLANQYHDQVEAMRSGSGKHHVSMPSPDKYPVCKDETGGN